MFRKVGKWIGGKVNKKKEKDQSPEKESDKVETTPVDGMNVANKEADDIPAKLANDSSSKSVEEQFVVQIINPNERYEVTSELGRGCFGVVKSCRDKRTNIEYAMKVMQKATLKNPGLIESEVNQLKKVGEHPNVVKLHDFFQDKDGSFYIIMELCKGGDLFLRIVEDGSYSEKRAAQLLYQLGSAIQHIHRQGIAHRDLKPENILLTDKTASAKLKVVDFGLSKFAKTPDALMSTVIGTWAYCAPEVFSRRPYTNAVDNWALGVLMFIMLAGYHPFDIYGDTPEPDLIDNICRGKYNFDEPEWQGISQEAKDIITKLLKHNPQERMSIDTFLSSPWISGQAGDKTLGKSIKRLKSRVTKPEPMKH